VVSYLLDTNALSEPFRPAPAAAFVARYRAHAGELAISVVTWHEALFGAARLPAGKRKRSVERYLREVVQPTFLILPYSQAAAEWHAQERARMEANGRLRPFADGQIAATARVAGLVLVTANIRDFRDFEGLRVENWMSTKTA
jgi:tRNA(fMet)-specific endonuclease VapC